MLTALVSTNGKLLTHVAADEKVICLASVFLIICKAIQHLMQRFTF